VVVTVDPDAGETGRRSVALPRAAPALMGACSARTDRAVLLDHRTAGGVEVSPILVVHRSSGATLLRRDYPASQVTIGAVSPDGLYAAGFARDHLHGAVIDLRSGRQVGLLDGQPLTPRAFSGDGRLLLLASSAGCELVEWRTGRTVWQTQRTALVMAAEPGAGTMSLVLPTLGAEGPPNNGPSTELIVRPDGSTVPVPAGSATP